MAQLSRTSLRNRLGAAALATLAACASFTAAAQQGPIKVGMALDISGPFS